MKILSRVLKNFSLDAISLGIILQKTKNKNSGYHRQNDNSFFYEKKFSFHFIIKTLFKKLSIGDISFFGRYPVINDHHRNRNDKN